MTVGVVLFPTPIFLSSSNSKKPPPVFPWLLRKCFEMPPLSPPAKTCSMIWDTLKQRERRHSEYCTPLVLVVKTALCCLHDVREVICILVALYFDLGGNSC